MDRLPLYGYKWPWPQLIKCVAADAVEELQYIPSQVYFMLKIVNFH